MTDWNATDLPPWFQRVTPRRPAQPSLFLDELPVVLAALRVSEDELLRWFKQGWVSFGPARETELEREDVDEIRFVRDVVRSGLPDAYVADLFDQLPRPLNVSPDEVAYSFTLGWVCATPLAETDPMEVVTEHIDVWLDDLAANEDQARLMELREQVDQRLGTLEKRAEESAD